MNLKQTSCLIVFLLLSSSLLHGQIELLGESIEGQEINGEFGNSIALDSVGSTVIIGAPYAEIEGNIRAGAVQVYEWIDDTWQQKGQTLVGSSENEFCGSNVAINDAGNIIAVVHLQSVTDDQAEINIYAYDGAIWQTLGTTLYEDQTVQFGRNLNFNTDGTILAVSAPFYDEGFSNNGRVNVYEFIDDEWQLRAPALFGDQNSDSFGAGMAMSKDSNTLVIYENKSISSTEVFGVVGIYDFDGTNYVKQDIEFYGDEFSGQFGSNLAINADGSIVVINDPFNDEFGESSGKVRVYQRESDDSWSIYGSVILGNESQSLGVKVDINDAGNRILTSSQFPNFLSGQAVLFDFIEGDWQQTEDPIDGVEINDNLGFSSSLSADGQRAGVGIKLAVNTSGVRTGIVNIYGLPNSLTTTDFTAPRLSLYPNPSQNELFLNNSILNARYEIYDLSGRQIRYGNIDTNRIDISELSSGMYLLKLNQSGTESSIKFIKN